MKHLTTLIPTIFLATVPLLAQSSEQDKDWFGEFLGRLSANEFDADSISNAFGLYGNPFSGKSIKNPFSIHGQAVRNPFVTIGSPIIVGEDGKFLGRLNQNPFDPKSVANPFGRYGNPFSPESINNLYGKYGNPFSPFSATNPYATQAPKIFAPSLDSLLDWDEP